MFVVAKTFKVSKNHSASIIDRFKSNSPLFHFDGFIKREVLLQSKHNDEDVIQVRVMFKDKKDYYRWEGSPEHIQMHKNQKEKPQGILHMESHTFELIIEDLYEEI